MIYSQITALIPELSLSENDTRSILTAENALNWVLDNTTVTFDIDNPDSVPATVKLWVSKYMELISVPVGISSENANGLSQSFDTSDMYTKLIELATLIFGEDAVTAGKARFVSASDRYSGRRRNVSKV